MCNNWQKVIFVSNESLIAGNGQEVTISLWRSLSPLSRRYRTRGALPIVRDNYRINKFTSRRYAYNISTSAKWYRDTVVYHWASYSPRPVTHCRASLEAFGSYPHSGYGANRATIETISKTMQNARPAAVTESWEAKLDELILWPGALRQVEDTDDSLEPYVFCTEARASL